MIKNEYKVLGNGVKIPVLGYGTFKLTDPAQGVESIKTALKLGYRHLDGASYYDNEELVGQAIRESGVPREEIFITSKMWNEQQGYEQTKAAFAESLKKLGTDYLDLYLIHWPNPLSLDTWRAMEELYDEGKIKAIGVCNFMIPHLEKLLANCRIKPMVNQVEFHPHVVQKDLMDFCEKNGIVVEAWAPLMRTGILEIPLLQELAEKYGKTIAQIVLRWDLQMGVVTLPKSATPQRIETNADIFNFTLSQEDMDAITALECGKRTGPDPFTYEM